MNITQLEPLTERKPPKNSEDELALRFTDRHCKDLRYVAPWGKWMIYQEGCWKPDETMKVFDLARAICREAAATCNGGENKKLASAKARAAVESLARSDRQHAGTTDQWDSDPWLLNTPGGVIDLRTGDIRPHERQDYMTKITAVGPRAGCKAWLAFLRRVTNGDDELRAFLQRMAGYALTGITVEHALFFLYGTGANGKSVFLNTLASVLGDYHRTAPIEAFLASHTERHPTDLAGLRGARLVTAIETEEGRRWDESKIKAITGGDKIAARFMRQDFFEFTPTFKLVIAGNHKPQLRNVDEAIKRRLHLVPFKVTIPPEERDVELPEKLKEEWPGILEWAIEGALDWSMSGLQPPEAVREATEDYLSAEDALAIWIEECCNTGDHFVATPSELYRSWQSWCHRAGEADGSQKRFSQNLEARGYRKSRDSKARKFHGISPKAGQDENWSRWD